MKKKIILHVVVSIFAIALVILLSIESFVSKSIIAIANLDMDKHKSDSCGADVIIDLISVPRKKNHNYT